MRRQQAVSLLIGVLSLVTLSMGVHSALPTHAAVAAPSTVGSVSSVVDRLEGAETSRSEPRPPLQLHRSATQTVRTVSHHPARPARHFYPRAYQHINGAAAWAASEHVRHLIQCESGGDPTVVSTHNGVTYYGLYQMDQDFWTTYGGDPSYLSSPFRAPVWMQNEVAYRGYLHRGFEPWACG